MMKYYSVYTKPYIYLAIHDPAIAVVLCLSRRILVWFCFCFVAAAAMVRALRHSFA